MTAVLNNITSIGDRTLDREEEEQSMDIDWESSVYYIMLQDEFCQDDITTPTHLCDTAESIACPIAGKEDQILPPTSLDEMKPYHE